MKQEQIARRYAYALVQIGQEKGQLDNFESELQLVKEVVIENKELQVFLESPSIPKQKKKDLVAPAFSFLSKNVLHTLFFLIDQNRMGILLEMIEMYIYLANEIRNIADAYVYSVRTLTSEEKTVLEATFARICQRDRIRIHNIVDTNLLGGVKVRIGNRVYDGSLAGKIARVAGKLKGGETYDYQS